MEDFIYTQEEVDNIPPPPKPEGDFPITKSIIAAANYRPVTQGITDYDKLIGDGYKELLPKLNEVDLQVADGAAKQGNAPLMYETLQSIQQRIDENEEGTLTSLQKLKEISTAFIDTVSTQDVGVVLNNTPEEMAAQSRHAPSVSMASQIEMAKVAAETSGFWKNAKGIAQELPPTAAFSGFRLGDFAERKLGKGTVGFWEGESDINEKLRFHYQGLSDADKAEFIKDAMSYLSEGVTTSKWRAALYVQQMIGEEEGPGVFTDVLNGLGMAGSLFAVTGIAKGVAAVGKGAVMTRKAPLIAAQVGAKPAQVAATGQALMKQGALTIAGQGTGVSDVFDLYKLAAGGVARVLPESITSASSALQQIIKDKATTALNEIRSTVKAGNVRPEEGARLFDNIMDNFNPNTNPMVHSLDVNAAGMGRIFFKPVDAASGNFLTKEAAEEFIKNIDPTGAMGLSIVKDTTNTGYLAGADALKALERERAVKEAELLKRLSELPKGELEGLPITPPTKAAPGPVSAPSGATRVVPPTPKALLDAKPKYKLATPKFASDVDKGVYQLTNTKGMASKSDPTVLAFVKEATGWDEAAIAEHGKALRAYMKSLPDVGDGSFTVKNMWEKKVAAPAAAPTPSPVKTPTLREELATTYTKIGDNAYLSASAAKAPEVQEFFRKMLPALGLEGRPVIVLNKGDKVPAGMRSEMAGLRSDKKLSSANGWFTTREFEGERFAIIHMNLKVDDIENYMTTLSHETGHYFMRYWLTEFGAPVKDAFNAWLKRRGITTMKDADWATLMQHFNSSKQRDRMAEMRATDKPTIGKKYAEWADDFEEWFCENFSKWSFSDKVPTSLFDKSMAAIVKSVREMFYMVSNILRAKTGALGEVSRVSADKQVARMMNEHVRQMLDGKLWGVQASSEIKALQSELAAMDDQIAAYKAADSGLTYGWLVERKVNSLDYRNLNPFKDDDINSIVKWNFGDWAMGTSSEAYKNRVVGVGSASRYLKLLTEYAQDALNPLNSKQKSQVMDALVRGDKETADLDDMTLTSMGLDDKAKKAYYDMRSLRNILYNMRNDAAVTSLTRKGYRNVIHPNLVDDNGAFTFGREVSKAAASGKLVFNAATNSRTRISGEVEAMLDSGEFRLFEMESTLTFGGVKNKYVLVPTAETTVAPIRTVIPYRQGEFKRIYEDDYFVRMTGIEEVDGVPTEFKATHRTAKNKTEAERYIMAFHAVRDAARAGKLTPDVAAKLQPYGWNVDEVMEEFSKGTYNDVSLISEFSRSDDDFLEKTVSVRGRFSSERGDALKNVSGEASPTANPLDSFAAEIQNTAFMVPITEWRDATIYRWFNTVRDALPLEFRDMNPEQAFFEMQRARREYVGNDKLKLFAQRVNDYVIHELSMVTKEEEKMQGLIRAMTEKMEGKFAGKKLEGAMSMTGAWLRQADPVGFARTVSFHSFLGGLNPVQLLVQGMNAVNAMAISPLHGLAASKNMPLIRVALMSDREDVWRHVAKAGKVLGVDQDEFVETVRAIRRSGLLDGINSTSLYGAETGKFSLTNGLLSKAGRTSAFMFNRGEEVSRIISFDIARREFIKAHPEKVWWDDDALNTIMERQDDLTQNMTNANLGAYQKGVLSIPTQFLQYNIKLGMNIIVSASGNPRAFTRKEVMSLFAFHAVVFGAAGYGVQNTPWINEVFGEAYNELDETARLYVQQGAIAGLINTMTEMFAGEDEGAEIAFGSRFQSLATYTDWGNAILDMFSTDAQDPDSPTVRDVLTGAAGSSIRRLINNTKSAWGLLIASDDLDLETTKEVLWLMGTGAFSSLNNIDKAIIAQNNLNRVMSKNGVAMYTVNDIEKAFLAIGIPPASAADYEVLMKDKKKREQHVRSLINQAKQYQMLAAQARLNGDEVLVKNYRDSMGVLRASLAELGPRYAIQFDKAMVDVKAETKLRELLLENLIKDNPKSLPVVNKNPGDVNG